MSRLSRPVRSLLSPLVPLCLVVLASNLALAQGPAGGDPTTTTVETAGGVTAAAPTPPPAPPRQLTLHPTLAGPIGLFNNFTADVGPQWTFRIALHAEIFRASDFLVVGDRNTRFAGSLQLGFTPFKFLEVWFQTYSTSNENVREDPNRQDPQVILALGDFSFGGKAAFKLAGGVLGLGVNFGLRFLNSVGGLTPSGDATSIDVRALGSVDLTKLQRRIPLRFHLNVGYIVDNSGNLVNIDDRLAVGISPTQAFVEQYAYGIAPSRVHFGLGIDAPFWLGPVGLQPIFEYTLAASTGDESPRVLALPELRGADNISGTLAQKITVGLRALVARGLAIEFASDIGLSSYGFAVGPPTAPYNLIIGLSYAFDPRPVVRVVTKEVPRGAVAVPTGTIRGSVKDARTQAPLADALVGFTGRNMNEIATRQDGTFESPPLPPGELEVTVRKEGYKPVSARVRVAEGRATKIDVSLAPATPPVGTVSLKIVDGDGKPMGARALFEGPTPKTVDVPGTGETSGVTLPPGEYLVKFDAPGYLAKQRPLSVKAGERYNLDVTMRKRPKRMTARLTRRAIVINRQVSFRLNSAEILPESYFILDEVADILIKNPQISRVRVEGHTDNTGTDAINNRLSQERADSVRQYLLQAGVGTDRLESVGYGARKPLVPNITPRNRARNRRVAFTILDQQKK